jgi:hypothetical protein
LETIGVCAVVWEIAVISLPVFSASFVAMTAACGPAPAIGGRSIVETGRSVERNTPPGAMAEQEIKRMSESARRCAAAHETLTAVSVC